MIGFGFGVLICHADIAILSQAIIFFILFFFAMNVNTI